MSRLVIVLDIDVDATLTDPEEVADDLLYDEHCDNKALRRYAECETEFVSARWTS